MSLTVRSIIRISESSGIRIIPVGAMQTVADLRRQVAQNFQLDPQAFSLKVVGKYMEDHQMLSDFNFDHHPEVEVYHRMDYFAPDKRIMVNMKTFEDARNSLRSILRTKQACHVVEVKLSSEEDLFDDLMAFTPQLYSDPTAYEILSHRDTLWCLLKNEEYDVHRLLSEHPSIQPALTFLANALKDDNDVNVRKPGRNSMYQDSRVLYSLDQMSDDEDEEEDAGDVNGRSQGNQGSGNQAEGSSSRPANVITNDYFRQAMLLASNPGYVPTLFGPSTFPTQPTTFSPQPAAQPSTSNAQVQLESQLQQLMEMGVVDEQMARRVLEETGGNLQLAIDMLFGNEF